MLTRILIIIMFLATACTPNPVQNSAPPREVVKAAKEPSADLPVPSPIVSEEPSESSEINPVPSPVVEDGLQKKITEAAVEDLASRLPANRETISVISTEAVTWQNASLGCPSLGKVYTQGKVSGFRIRLKVNGQIYDYHTDRTGRVVLCLEPEVKPDEPGLR